ncbi:MAG: trypsin-like peptidase domain-containing protein [Oscillospiraceae bacterium]|nr:trypsin-like peptidase domain-containing protein [Oscillospiraceae bacterium]
MNEFYDNNPETEENASATPGQADETVRAAASEPEVQNDPPAQGAAPQNSTPQYTAPQNGWAYQYQPPKTGAQQGGYAPYGGYSAPGQAYQQPGAYRQQQGGYNGYGVPVQSQAPKAQANWDFQGYDHLDAKNNGKNGKKKHTGLKVLGALICCVLTVAVIGLAVFGVYNLVDGSMTALPENVPSSSSSEEPGNPVEEGQSGAEREDPGLVLAEKPATSAPAADGELTTPEIAKKVAPSVVGIVKYQSQQLSSTGEGSGIILTADGYIVTNAHVISGADSIKVVLNNGDNYEGRIIGSDAKTDLAVIKIEAENLTYAELGDSAAMEVGERVIAIGNPGGLTLAGSVTQGIVSAVDRPVKVSDGYTMNYLQIDAAINPGNSGGALVNAYGQVIGINSQKIAATDYEGIGFAIPTSEAKPIIDDLISYGRVTGRVKLGITAYAIDEYAARMTGFPSGIRVGSTEAGSDIAAKGVVPGDIITAINGEAVASFSDVAEALRNFKPGDQVTLDVYRLTSSNARPQTFQVQVILMEDTGETVPATQYNN